MICLFVLTEYTNVTDTQIYGQTPHDDIGRTCTASHGNEISLRLSQDLPMVKCKSMHNFSREAAAHRRNNKERQTNQQFDRITSALDDVINSSWQIYKQKPQSHAQL